MADALTDARTAFADRRWQDAYVLFAAADAAAIDASTAANAPGAADRVPPLTLDDLGLYGRSASLIARDPQAFALLERCYTASLAVGDELRAAEFAFWFGFRLFSLGEAGRAQA